MLTLFDIPLAGCILANRAGVAVTLAGEAWTAIEGTARYRTRPRKGGTPLDIEGGEDYGWIRKEDLDELVALANAGTTGTLQDGAVSYPVRFRYEDPPVFQFSPLFPDPEPTGETWYTGTIKLITLEAS